MDNRGDALLLSKYDSVEGSDSDLIHEIVSIDGLKWFNVTHLLNLQWFVVQERQEGLDRRRSKGVFKNEKKNGHKFLSFLPLNCLKCNCLVLNYFPFSFKTNFSCSKFKSGERNSINNSNLDEKEFPFFYFLNILLNISMSMNDRQTGDISCWAKTQMTKHFWRKYLSEEDSENRMSN